MDKVGRLSRPDIANKQEFNCIRPKTTVGSPKNGLGEVWCLLASNGDVPNMYVHTCFSSLFVIFLEEAKILIPSVKF